MIEVKSISKAYGTKKIFNSLGYDFINNTIYALIGVNGIGKSTFLNLLTQSGFRDTGLVQVDKISIDKFDSKYHFFYVPDRKDMFLNLTGMEYLSFISKIYDMDSHIAASQIEELTSILKLKNDLGKCLKNYSLGMKQKIYLIAAFISGANNLLFDEPFNGLDPEISYIVKKIILEYKSDNTLIIYSLHNLDMVSNFCDVILFIDKNHEIYSMNNNKNLKELERVFFEHCVTETKYK